MRAIQLLPDIFQHFLILENQESEDFIIGNFEGLLVKLEPIAAAPVKPSVGAYKGASAPARIAAVEHIERV